MVWAREFPCFIPTAYNQTHLQLQQQHHRRNYPRPQFRVLHRQPTLPALQNWRATRAAEQVVQLNPVQLSQQQQGQGMLMLAASRILQTFVQ